MVISGVKIILRPARKDDREKIYLWLAHSDITPSVMGPPKYRENPVPAWEEFCEDYQPHFFHTSGDGKGRNYIILLGDEEIGTIGYDCVDLKKRRAVLDIWLRAERFCGFGYGSDALETLCKYLHEKYKLTSFIISPSARNERAVAAYRKSGFHPILMDKGEQEKEFGKGEYEDTIIMIKRM